VTPSLPFSFPAVLRAYDNPRDLLLDLIEQHGGTLDRLPLGPVTTQYLAYVEAAGRRELASDSDWILFAATLIWWKSRALLPSDPALGDPRPDQLPPELARELRKRERPQAAAQLLQAQLARENGIFSRPSTGDFREPLPPEAEDAPFFSLFDLIRLFEDLQRQSRLFDAAKREPPLEIAPEEVSTQEMMSWFRDQMAQEAGQFLDGSALLDSQESPARRNALFLAMLETARNQEIRIQQEEVFAQVRCWRQP